MRMVPGARFRRIRRAAIVAMAAIWAGLPGAAAAQNGRTVAVIDATAGPTGDPEVTELVNRIDAQLDKELDLVPVASERRPALVGGIPDERQGTASEARSALTRARDALVRFDHADAIAEADRGLARALELAPDAEISKLLADLAFARGLARHGAKLSTEASGDFALVHRLDAGRTLDPVKYKRDVVAVFDAAATAGDPVALDIEAPAGATVWVDGTAVGEAPAAVLLSPGLHAVTVTGPTLVTRGQIAEVPATGTGLKIRVDAAEASSTVIVHRLRRAVAAAAAADDDAALTDAVALLVRGVGAQDAIVVGRDGEGALITRLYSGRTGTLGEPKPGAGADPERLLAPVRPIRRALPPDGPDPEVPLPPPVPWWKRRWVKIGIGSGVAVGVLTTIVVLVTQPDGASMLQGPIKVP
jgi:hypothetical protein